MENKQKIIFVLLPHKLFGHTILPFVVTLLKDNSFSIKSIEITPKNFNSYTSLMDDSVYEIIKKTFDYSNSTIFSVFGYGYKEEKQFFNDLKPEKPKFKLIRDYYSRTLDIVIKKIRKNKIPIYYCSKTGSIIDETPLYFSDNYIKIEFNLKYENNLYKYSINSYINNEPILLNFKDTIILGDSPCWIIHKNKIYETNEVNGKKIEPFLSKREIEIPAKLFENFLKKFGKSLIENYDVTFTNIEVSRIKNKPTPVLKLTRNILTGTGLCLFFNYHKFITHPNDCTKKQLLYNKNSEGIYSFEILERDFDSEKEYIDFLLDLGLQQIQDNIFIAPDTKIIDKTNENEIEKSLVIFLNKNYDTLIKKGFYIVNETNKNYYLGRLTIEYKIKENIDWFDLSFIVKIDENTEIPFSAIVNNIIENNPYLQLKDGRIIILPQEWFARLSNVLPLVKNYDDSGLKISHSQYFTVHEILEFENKFYNFISDIKSKKFQILTPPEMLKKNLREYQKVGFSWLYFLWNNKFGGCLADDMGLGKTIQVIALLAYLKQHHSKKRGAVQLYLFEEFNESILKKSSTSLIICPLSLVKNWTNEIIETAPSLSFFIYNGNNKTDISSFDKFDVIITTYGNIRNNIEEFKEFYFDCIIVDESQHIKNPETKIYNAIMQLNSNVRFVLTGTPIENSLTDLWAQFNFLNKNMLGDLNFFKKTFYDPIHKQKSKGTKSKFHNIINPFILRRTKEQVLKELPALNEKICYCQMTPEQQQIYEIRKSEIRNFIIENNYNKSSNMPLIILSGLMRLRLIANHPAICEKDYPYSSGKFEEVINHIHKIIDNKYKLVIFSQFVKHLDIYAHYFQRNNIPYLIMTGKTPEKQRNIIVNTFQETDEFNILLMTLKTGGIGLNLTAAEYVFIIDPWWNPAVEQQAINRLHRIGQEKPVFAYRFITENSIEEKILLLQQNKKILADNILDNIDINKLTINEVEKLLE